MVNWVEAEGVKGCRGTKDVNSSWVSKESPRWGGFLFPQEMTLEMRLNL